MSRDSALDVPSGDTLAMGLGWFSIALGVAELAAPHSVARFVGVAPTEKTIATLRSFGAREVGTGLAILAQPDRPAWLWSRVAGDAVDLATLGTAMNSSTTDQRRAVMAAAAVLGVTVLDIICARQLSDSGARSFDDEGYGNRYAAEGRLMSQRDNRVRVSESITINQSLDRVEQRWSDTDSLPEALRFCRRSSDGGDERAIIEMRHAPGGRGTEVRVEMEYTPRGGALGAALARIVGGDPTGRIRQDLKRFKQIVETGEIVLSDGPSLWRPGQPAKNVQEIHKAAGLEVQG
jgi:uncharacterized membrane protein